MAVSAMTQVRAHVTRAGTPVPRKPIFTEQQSRNQTKVLSCRQRIFGLVVQEAQIHRSARLTRIRDAIASG